MDDVRLSEKQLTAVRDALVNFVLRVAAHENNTYDAETAILPAVANILLSSFL